MSEEQGLNSPEQRLQYFAFSTGSWLRSYASLQLRQLRLDEHKHAREIRQMTRLMKQTPEFSRCEEQLPDLSQLLVGAVLKKYELRRKQYAERYRALHSS